MVMMFSAFEGFSKLNKSVALEAMNNADQRMIDHREKMNDVFSKGSDAEYEQYKMEQRKLNSESRHYADAWLSISDYEARLDIDQRHGTSIAKEVILVEADPCGYCGSTAGYEGWHCLNCGGS